MTQGLILVIDFSESVLEIISLVLKQENYNVIPFLKPPGTSVVDIKPDLVIMDISLDSSLQEDFYRSLKNNTATSNIPVLLTSTFSGQAKIAEKWKAEGFIDKPFDIDELAFKVNELLMKQN
jgi:two-component system phosphate regulon response regulator PhoB